MEVTLSWYQVADLERAKKFYGESLGLKKTIEISGWVEFSHAEGAASIGLNQMRENDNERGATVVLRVEDLARAQEDLMKKDVKFEGSVEEIPGVVRIATFRDPDGNRLQLVQVLAVQ
ncbi:MAG TPA: VOC family protein [Blastocatellia bacterium]|nr:VOC family protein [Blastocatellia bacterium]